jgi:hypothetical protein
VETTAAEFAEINYFKYVNKLRAEREAYDDTQATSPEGTSRRVKHSEN